MSLAARSAALEYPNDVAISVHDVDPVPVLPDRDLILEAARDNGFSQHLEASLGVGAAMEVSKAFAFEPLVPFSQTL